MATDLFGKYYNNPTKSYVYADMLCNGASGDEISFDIVDNTGVISNNENALSSIDLSGIHVSLTQYTNDMKIIDPYGLIYVKGISQGGSFTRKAFGVISDKVLETEDWQYRTTLIAHIKYVNDFGDKVIKCITASGNILDEISFIDVTQELLDDAKIPINVTYENNYLYFTSTVEAYDFWIANIELMHYLGDNTIEDDFPEIFSPNENSENSSNDLGFGYDNSWDAAVNGGIITGTSTNSVNAYTTPISEEAYRYIYDNIGKKMISDTSTEFTDMIPIDSDILFNSILFEDLTKYAPPIKYRNGAMKGCIVVATYPEFNDDDILPTQRSLKIGHLVDRVEEFFTLPEKYDSSCNNGNCSCNNVSNIPLYVKILRDVVDSYYSQYEFDMYKKWSNGYSYMNTTDSWIEPGEIPVINFDQHDKDEWTHSRVPYYYMLNTIYNDENKYEALGLHGYATYLSKHNLWLPMGQLYARTAVEDDESQQTKNLISSFIIYNPNPFPVTINYMTFI